MATFKCFEEIKAWQKARLLNQKIGHYIDSGRFKNNYRLIGQIEGSAGSIMSNIAEGFERSGNKEFIQLLYISKGSCGEFRSQLYQAIDREYIGEEEFQELKREAVEMSFILSKLIQYLEQSEFKGSKYKDRNV